MNGYVNLLGQTLGTLQVGNRVSLSPLKWEVRCTKCGTSWAELHSQLMTNPVCRNNACGRTVEAARPSARVDSIPTGARSRDSESARDFVHAQRQQRVVMAESTFEAMASNPDGLRSAMNYQRR